MPRGIFLHKPCSKEKKEKIKNSNLGKTRTAEAKKKMSLSHLGKHLSEETKNKLSISLKGHAPWSKGLTKETNESLANRSKKLIGKISPQKGKTYEEIYGEKRGREMKIKHSGNGNGMFNKTHTLEARKCISEGQKKAILSGKFIPLNNSFKGNGFRNDLDKFFRSRWEANFARILNYLRIIWEYEQYRFKLNNGQIYIPDFYLPQLDLYVEVKGTRFGNRKLDLLYQQTPNFPIKIVDEEVYNKLDKMFSNKISNWEVNRGKLNHAVLADSLT